MAVCAGAVLVIGDDVGISGASIFCASSITIGDNVLIGVNCSIYDTDFHPVHWYDRRMSKAATSLPVRIGDDVWLSAGVIVLKGTSIGARSVIAAGSVVTKDIPPDTLAAGVPARPVRKLSSERR
ncbi:DapH/DapD/GlmU-related protein [Mesorhizobium sp.]